MMNGMQAEKRLAILYSSAAVFSTISSVSLVVAWQHWAWTLDSCINVDCECILYGVNTFSTFMGGDVKLCHFGTYAVVPAVFFGLVLGVYHGYRSCISRNLDGPRGVRRSAAYCSRYVCADNDKLRLGCEDIFDIKFRRWGVCRYTGLGSDKVIIACGILLSKWMAQNEVCAGQIAAGIV